MTEQHWNLPRGGNNEVHGDVYGPVVQAGKIGGDVHVHHSGSAHVIPQQLPPAPLLISRNEQLAALDEVRDAHSPQAATVVVSGPAGIGKSALALYWGHTNQRHFADGTLYADLRGHAPGEPESPSAILGQWLRALGQPSEAIPENLAERTSLYRSLIAQRRLLVVLDDALSIAQVRPLLPPSARGLALVTSRQRLAGLLAEGASSLLVPPLRPDAALDLLSRIAGVERVTSSPEAARELVGLCANWPLAVCLAGARLAARPQWPLQEMVVALRQGQQRLAALATGEEQAMRGALDLSHQGLPSDAARMYRLLGLFPGTTFDSGAAAALAAMCGPDARKQLGVLTDANLLEDVPNGRYRFHDLVRVHARQKAEQEEPEPAREVALRGMVDFYLHSVDTADACLRPYRRERRYGRLYAHDEPDRFPTREAALAWLDAEFANVRAVVKQAWDRDWLVPVWQLVDALWSLFLHRGDGTHRLELEQLGLSAAQSCGELHAQAKLHNRLGLTHREREEFDLAEQAFRHALELWRELDDRYRIAGSLRRLGLVAADRHHVVEAIEFYQQAQQQYEALGERRNVGLVLLDLGRVCTTAGRHGRARTYLQAARETLSATSDPYNHARVVIELGRAYVAGDDLDSAAVLLDEGAETMRELGSVPGQADALEQLGHLAERSGQLEQACRYYTDAIDVLANPATPRSDRLRGRIDEVTKI